MPPLFTSTTVGTLLRKALSAARHVHPVGVPRPSPLIGSKLSPIERARLVARRVVQHAQKTFPSLNTPAHRLGYALEPIRLPTQAARRGLPHQSRSAVQSRLYSTTKATFQAAYRLPAHARGSRVSTSVGLGSARAYSGGAAGGGGAQSLLQNVPLGFRALYEGLKDEDLEGRWPAHTKRYRPYCPVEARHRSRKLRQSRRLDRATSVACSIDSARTGSFFADRAHYFPLPGRSRGVAAEVPALLVPEALVTPGTTTTLVLPVAATLQAILQPTTHIPYADAELGVAVFAELFAGVGEVALASDTVLGCVLPVLAKLRSLGVLEEHGSERTREGPLVVGSVTRDTLGEPQTIVFDFHDRSESDVRTILGETLKKNVLDQEWWYIQEIQSETAGRPASPTPPAIESEVNVWAHEVAHSVPRAREIEVVMPTMSLDLATVADLSSSWDDHSDREDSMIATPLSALGSELYFDGSVGSVLSDLSPLSSDSDSDADGDGRLAGHFSPHDLRERLALYAHYDGDISGFSDDASSVSGWTSSGPSETDEAVELAVEPVTASYLLPEPSSSHGAGIAGFDHGLMLVNYW